MSYFKLMLFLMYGVYQISLAFDDTQECKYDPMHIAYVKSKYEQSFYGIDVLFYPAKNPQRLYILCNGATVGKYTMWSWFWRDDEAWEDTAYLFLKDDAIRWYLGTQEEPLADTYCAIIATVMEWCGLTANQVLYYWSFNGWLCCLTFCTQIRFGRIICAPATDRLANGSAILFG